MFGVYEPLVATLLLLCGVGAAGFYFNYVKNKRYQLAMLEYEQAVAALRLNATAAPAAERTVTVGKMAGGEVLLSSVDEKTAATLMAIVAHTVGGNPSDLRFRSITAK